MGELQRKKRCFFGFFFAKNIGKSPLVNPDCYILKDNFISNN
jgi:hypothetical protein